MKSPVIKRSIVIAGHKTSVSLEDAFWTGLKEIALSRRVTLSDLVAAIDSERQLGNLSSAIRLFVLDHYKARIGVHADGRPAPREMMMMPPSAASGEICPIDRPEVAPEKRPSVITAQTLPRPRAFR